MCVLHKNDISNVGRKGMCLIYDENKFIQSILMAILYIYIYCIFLFYL